MTAVPSIERSNVSFASLLRMLNNRSISEKLRNRLLDSDLGKQVTWSGYVRQVRTNIGDKDRAHLLVISPQKERSWDVALCWFDAGRENKIRDLPVGDPVTVTGVLSLDATGGPALDGCRLERTATAPAVNPRRR